MIITFLYILQADMSGKSSIIKNDANRNDLNQIEANRGSSVFKKFR